jgi:hypothetical protein
MSILPAKLFSPKSGCFIEYYYVNKLLWRKLMLDAIEELLFWTGILNNHGEFILKSLSIKEQPFILNAQHFKNLFFQLNLKANALKDLPNESNNVISLVNKTLQAISSFVSFKKLLLRKSLQCAVEISLPPTFINHMINEAVTGYNTLSSVYSNMLEDKVTHDIELHKIWLPDASGHAATIAADLDPTEAELIKKSEAFKNDFNNLFIKSRELGIMLKRASLEDGALEQFNQDVIMKMNEFIEFLEMIKELRQTCRILGTISPLIPDHMIREEKYYLEHIKR